MPVFSLEQIKAFAPDASGLSAANGLAKATSWALLAKNADSTALWGEIKGSGKSPYQARIDLTEPAFKCSCPSRKFPCKHGLALLMVHAASEASFQTAEQPDWVSDWLHTRLAKANKPNATEKAALKEAELADLSDLEREALRLKEAKKLAKASANKAEKADAGIAQCSLFLQDVVRRGFSQLAQTPMDFDGLSAQLVDAQLPGLARLMREAGVIQYSGVGWEHRLMRNLGRIELIVAAYRRKAHLGDALTHDLEQALGYSVAQEDILKEQSIRDDWMVLGHSVVSDGQVITRRSWLRGNQTKRNALILTFAAGNQALAPAWPAGLTYNAELAFYPGALKLRALVKGTPERTADAPLSLAAAQTIEGNLTSYAQGLALTPWLAIWPMLIENIVLQQSKTQPNQWLVAQSEASEGLTHIALPISPEFQQQWHWLAVTGGNPCSISGEWNGETFTPLAIWYGSEIYIFASQL